MGQTQCQSQRCCDKFDENDVLGEEPLEAGLTTHDRAIVKDTWRAAKGLGVETVGVLLFKNIFELAPAALKLFPFQNDKNMYESSQLKSHATRVVTTVDTAVSMLDELPALVPVLQSLALKHVGYGVLPDHYPVVGQALLKTLKGGLGTAFTSEVEAAWLKVWKTIETTMVEATENPTTGELTEKDRSIVETSWNKAKGLGAEIVGVLVFRNIFKIAPSALQLFSFKDEPNLYESAALKSHGTRVVTTVDTAVFMLDDLEGLVPVLESLALRHMAYGVAAEHYPVVGKALIETLRAGLGAGFSRPVEAAWTKVWKFIETTMIGATKNIPSSGPLTSTDTIFVEASWEKAKALGMETVGVLLFRNIFEIAPQALLLFSFKDEPDMFESPNLKSHADRVVGTVDTAVSMLGDLESLAPILQGLAMKHVGYGILPEHYACVGKALVKTLKAGLAAAFVPQVEAAWLKVWTLIERTMIDATTKLVSSDFTSLDQIIIQSSWSKVEDIGSEAVGLMLFSHIFEIEPRAISLFPFSGVPNMYESPQLKQHAIKVIDTVGTAVSMLGDMTNLVPVLESLALRHVSYGIAAEHYPIVGKALMKTLKAGLGAGYSAPVEAAWTKLWKLMETTMVGVTKKLSPKGSLTSHDTIVVQTSWSRAKALGPEYIGVVLFKNIFEIAPEAVQLFSFKDDKPLLESPKLKAHASKVITTVDVAVGSLTDLTYLAPVLQELALKHTGYGVIADHYPVVGQALIKTLKTGLGAAFTAPVEASWVKVWTLLETTMVGAAKAKAKKPSAKSNGSTKKQS